jgi:hypothetical protein
MKVDSNVGICPRINHIKLDEHTRIYYQEINPNLTSLDYFQQSLPNLNLLSPRTFSGFDSLQIRGLSTQLQRMIRTTSPHGRIYACNVQDWTHHQSSRRY